MNPLVEGVIAFVLIVSALGGSMLVGYKYAENESKLAMEEYTAKVQTQTQKLKDEDAAALNQIQNDKLAAVADYQSRLDAANTAYNAAMRMLRDANSDRSRLKTAAAAPAECRSFAAPPTQLSVPDAAVALGIAKDGDDAIIELGLCQTEYNSLIARINGEK